MALTTTTIDPFPLKSSEPPAPPPDVAVTPCDPWPRPYYLSEGLRRVAPYHYTYNTYCKERWRGREILDIFAKEFRDRSREYYKHAIETGQIAINGTPCADIHQPVKNGDVVSHTLHRHEPPVTAQPIRAISETDNMIVIDKPAGVPVHPAGRYNYNSIVEIMRAERHYAFNPLPCNRLDRLTSGVMFVAKDKQDAERISEKLRGRTMRKEYIARVKGRFPDGEGEVNGNLGGVVKCEENILQISPILGLNRARASGKTAKTLFRRVVYFPPKQKNNSNESSTASTPPASDISSTPSLTSSNHQMPAVPAPPLPATESADGYSIVHCLPLTGRTHQIRVHLQFLGHPITNDPIYANRRVFGSKLAIHDSSSAEDEEIIRRLAKMGKTEVADAIDYDNHHEVAKVEQTMQTCLPRATSNGSDMTLSTKEATTPTEQDARESTLPFSTPEEFSSFVRQHDEMVADYNKRKGEKMTGEKCDICHTDLYSDPGPQELGIYLHALAYSDQAGEWKFRSEVPGWALPQRTNGGMEETEREELEREIRDVLGKGWVYDGSEVPPPEMDNKALNRAGMRRNKFNNGER
jgi:tRNA pseudouridine32 synthase